MPQVKMSSTKAIIYQFESQLEITDYTMGTKFRPQDAEFTGGEAIHTWQDAQTKAKSTWEPGIETLNMFVERLRQTKIPEIKSHKRKIVWGPTGDELDVEKLAAGDPNCWKSYAREESTGPTTLTVFIDTSTPYYVAADEILWRGAAAIALTHILEEKGFSVELWVVNGSKLFDCEDNPVMTACCLKRTSDPLDQSTLVNTVAGWFYRTVTFTLLDTICDKAQKRRAYGFGSVATPVEADLDQISPDLMRIYSAGVFTFNGAVGLMEEELHKLSEKGVETKGE